MAGLFYGSEYNIQDPGSYNKEFSRCFFGVSREKKPNCGVFSGNPKAGMAVKSAFFELEYEETLMGGSSQLLHGAAKFLPTNSFAQLLLISPAARC